ncbi:hypothetical protein O6H91_06G067600 [Diphasiastrum complanatum]|uniref:Uncharacterized protein n=1 Tax=Diphasiastrum complanatum TaxID=34168 RepID=A0ACC2DEN4_DIPCM|nr:hypothetical protein O6H91_06G067600 [Diphasiastrum complanatum]
MAMALVKDLVNLGHHLSANDRPRVCQRRNSAILIQRVRLVTPLFEEIRDWGIALPPSALLAFKEFHGLLQKIKLLLEECRDRSLLWCLLQSESISQKFQEISLLMAATLRRIPLNLLDISSDIKEQIQLVRSLSERAKKILDPCEEKMHQELLQLLEYRSLNSIEISRIREFFDLMHLSSYGDFIKEVNCLHKEMQSLSSIGDERALSSLERLLGFSCSCRRLLYGPSPDAEEASRSACSLNHIVPAVESNTGGHESAGLEVINPPHEFNCPISLELMTDPVTIATGQTYDLSSITQWFAAGNRTCPKSGLKLTHLGFIPNFSLRSLINQWCDEHKQLLYLSNPEDKICCASKETLWPADSIETAKMTAAFLVGKLATGSSDVQEQAVYELRLLAKTGMENRKFIAEAGAIPFLVPLLSSEDSAAQENAVTALLNLSIYNNNKALIIAADALDPILEVLRTGNSMEARENAAATVFSLSVVDEFKITIGSTSEAIPALLQLLLEGTVQGKMDAISTLFNLSLYDGNRPKVVQAGTIPLLVDILQKDEMQIIDDALAVLALLARSVEGLSAINALSALPLITQFLNQGSSRSKENAARVVLSLCRTGGDDMKGCILKLPDAISSLQVLITSGTPRARRKARSVLKLLHSCNANVAARIRYSLP